MYDACSGAADDQQGTKTGRWNTHSSYVFVCPEVISHGGLGPTTTISILTSGLEHKYRPEFKPRKVKSSHK